MRTTKLGQLTVSAQGLGCMGMSEWYGATDWDESVATINRALDLGVTFIDTADIYGAGHNEVLVGRAIAHRRGDVPYTPNRQAPNRQVPYQQVPYQQVFNQQAPNQQPTGPSWFRIWTLVIGTAVAVTFVALALALWHGHSSSAPATNGAPTSTSVPAKPITPVSPVNPAKPTAPVTPPAQPTTPVTPPAHPTAPSGTQGNGTSGN